MAGRLIIQGLEYVVTDGVATEDLGYEGHEARNVIAVVRPISRRRPRRMPRWAAGLHCVAVVAPDGASGVKIRPGQIRPSGRAGGWTNGRFWWKEAPRSERFGGLRVRARRSGNAPAVSGPASASAAAGKASCAVRPGHRALGRGGGPPALVSGRWSTQRTANSLVSHHGGSTQALGPSTREKVARWGKETTTLIEKMRSYEVVEAGPRCDCASAWPPSGARRVERRVCGHEHTGMRIRTRFAE